MKTQRLFLAGLLIAVQSQAVPDSALAQPARAARGRISGVVFDSLAGTPLAKAWVQLVSMDAQAQYTRTEVADSLGRFAFDTMPDGRFWLAFLHPKLDSLPVELPPHAVTVSAGRSVRIDLGIPSPATLNASICKTSSAGAVVAPSGGVVIGVIRNARERAPVADARVTGEWLEISIRAGGYDRRRPVVQARTGPNGWFALCNAPAGGTMLLQAVRGTDDTDLIEVQVPANGFLRRDLYVGAASVADSAGSTISIRDTMGGAGRLRTGHERVSGTVVAVGGDRPLTNATVRIINGPSARTNARGEWAIVNAPAGTRMLEIRAVGYYPQQRVMDVMEGVAPLHVALSTFKAVLDTVRVQAARAAIPSSSGFELRRRSGMGQYLTAADFARRGAIEVSDVFRNMSGVRVELGHIYVRSSFGAEARCEPAVYINGRYMFNLTADEIDASVRLRDILAMEVYNEATVPPQFQQALSGCGSIVIWAK